jgi:hypothetical protein
MTPRGFVNPHAEKMDALRRELPARLQELRALLGTVDRHSPEAEQVAEEIRRVQRMFGAIGGAA